MQLDHVIIGVHDLDAATRRYEAILGVPAAVRSDHASGTSNALFLLEQGPYLELLASRPGGEDSVSVATLRTFLVERGEGLFGLALTPDDIDGAVAHLRGLGLDLEDAKAGSGVDASGRVREWRGVRLPAGAWPNAYSLLVEHTGWDWQRDLKRDPAPERAGSAVTGIHHIVFSVADAGATSAGWQERYGLHVSETIDMERMGAKVLIHPAGGATIEAVGATRPDGPVAERIAQRGEAFSGIAFEVADVDAAVAAVRAHGVTVTDPAPGVLANSRVARIDPGSAHGVAAQLLQFG